MMKGKGFLILLVAVMVVSSVLVTGQQHDTKFVKAWAEWQRAFQRNIGSLKDMDNDPDIPAVSKINKWKELLTAFRTDNPYSTEDEAFRKYAGERIEYWQGESSKPQIPTPLIDNPFDQKFNQVAKKVKYFA